MSNKNLMSISFSTKYESDIEADLVALVTPRARAALVKAGDLLESRIKAMLDQRGSGRIYKSKKTGAGMHQASAPGEAPAPDRGEYRDSWHASVTPQKEEITMTVWSSLWSVFGRRLELGGFGGGVYIAPRPHARPVWEASQTEIQKILDEM
jgi:hypothetical protein